MMTTIIIKAILYFCTLYVDRDYVDKSRGNDVISNTLEAAGVWDFFQHSLVYNIISFSFLSYRVLQASKCNILERSSCVL